MYVQNYVLTQSIEFLDDLAAQQNSDVIYVNALLASVPLYFISIILKYHTIQPSQPTNFTPQINNL